MNDCTSFFCPSPLGLARTCAEVTRCHVLFASTTPPCLVNTLSSILAAFSVQIDAPQHSVAPLYRCFPRRLSDIRVDWETYNVDLNDRPHVEESVGRGDAPLPDHADGSEAVSGSDENIREAPERNDQEGREASTRDVAVILHNTLESF